LVRLKGKLITTLIVKYIIFNHPIALHVKIFVQYIKILI